MLINITFKHIRANFISFQENALQIGAATTKAASATKQSKANLTQLQLNLFNIFSIASATEEISPSITSVMENMLVASNGAENAVKETVNG
jgi:hypothetical protein